jgi:hypothetical protein
MVKTSKWSVPTLRYPVPLDKPIHKLCENRLTSSTFTFLWSSAGCWNHFHLTNQKAGCSNTFVSDAGSLCSQVVVYSDVVNRPGVPLVWPCVLHQWRPCVTGLGVREISRGGLQHPLHGILGDVANCPGVPLVWPCVLPQWRPCVTGLGVRKISRGGLQHPSCAYSGDIVADCPGVSLVWSCVLPQWRPCTT